MDSVGSKQLNIMYKSFCSSRNVILHVYKMRVIRKDAIQLIISSMMACMESVDSDHIRIGGHNWVTGHVTIYLMTCEYKYYPCMQLDEWVKWSLLLVMNCLTVRFSRQLNLCLIYMLSHYQLNSLISINTLISHHSYKITFVYENLFSQIKSYICNILCG